jgi:chemotaxis protein methyltransferase CheR
VTSEIDYSKFKFSVAKHVGIDLDSYKPQQMMRRLDGYTNRKGLNLADLGILIGKDPEELQQIKDFLTINVSEFFRDSHQFEKLKAVALPELLKHRSRLKIWSAGASHGGEAYTLAIMLAEMTRGKSHEILGSDLDQTILKRASAGGPYAPADVRAVPAPLLKKHFKEVDGSYFVNDQIKKSVRFKQQNLLKSTFPADLDLIMCRNVVIYFSDDAKEVLNKAFHKALRAGGWLFIGGTETLHQAEKLGFERVDSSLYRKSADSARLQRAA